MPLIIALALSMSVRPSSNSKVAVLPAPFGPKMPKISRLSIDSAISPTAAKGSPFLSGWGSIYRDFQLR